MNASKNDRLVNYITDLAAFYVLLVFFYILPFDFTKSYVFAPLLYFLYYFFLEMIFNRTVGKLITRTKVVSAKNKAPHVFHILARTILRLVPIDAFSYLMGNTQGIHDVLSQTKLVKNQDKTYEK